TPQTPLTSWFTARSLKV
ncbi:ABC-2 transporter family protein, partial [Vibrio parahaemolyticus V-223/04]